MKNPMNKKITRHILVTNCELGDNDSLLTVLTRAVLFALFLPVGVAVLVFSLKILFWILNAFGVGPLR